MGMLKKIDYQNLPVGWVHFQPVLLPSHREVHRDLEHLWVEETNNQVSWSEGFK